MVKRKAFETIITDLQFGCVHNRCICVCSLFLIQSEMKSYETDVTVKKAYNLNTDVEKTSSLPTVSLHIGMRLKRNCSRDHICENTLEKPPAPVFAVAIYKYDACS